jgi:putative salt-induced outer membrane protein YdiY
MSILLALSLALAQDVAFSETEKEADAVDEAQTSLGAELGGQLTTGNTEFYVLTGGLNGAHRWKRSKLGLVLGTNLGRTRVDTDGNGTLDSSERSARMKETAQKAFADARYDYYISDKDAFYGLAGGLHDYYAGLSLRTHEQFGYSRTLVGNDSTTLLAEIGLDDAQEWQLVDGVRQDMIHILAGRLMVNLNHTLNEGVGIEASVEAYENFLDPADLRVYTKAALNAKLSDLFSLRLSNQITFDHQPVPGFRPLDQSTTVTLVASIL